VPRPLVVVYQGIYQSLVVWAFYLALIAINIASIFVLTPQRWYILDRNRIVVLYRQHLHRLLRRIYKMACHKLQYYNETTDATCHICDEVPLISQLASMNCDCEHMFCFNCIHQWSYQQRSCPLCRKSFNVISSCATSWDILRERETFALVPTTCLDWLEPRALALGLALPVSISFFSGKYYLAFTLLSMTTVLIFLDHKEARRAMIMTIPPSLIIPNTSPLTALLPSFLMAVNYGQAAAIVALFIWLLWYTILNLVAMLPWYVSVITVLLFGTCPELVADLVESILQIIQCIRAKMQKMLQLLWKHCTALFSMRNLAVVILAAFLSYASPYVAEILVNRSRAT